MNTTTVQVPRELLERLRERLDPHMDARDWGMVCDLLAQPEVEPEQDVPEWPNDPAYRWMAQDSNGQWWAYIGHPKPLRTAWMAIRSGYIRLRNGQPNPNWSNTLRERQEGE